MSSMEAQQVRDAIRTQIERREKRISALQAENRHELLVSKRMLNEVTIMNLSHAIDTLIELEHILRLCDCPAEAYVSA